MALRKSDNPDIYARIEEKNLLRQYDLLTNCIEIGLIRGIDAFDKYTLWSLNAAATANIAQHGGRYREQPIYVGNHIPPHFERVSHFMDQFISDVHENWDILTGPTEMAAFALWRMNWIHPFVEGNGRTARAACYYLICLRAGTLLPGTKIVPERIRENRPAYYSALQYSDRAWAEGHFDVSELSNYLNGLLLDQLSGN
jgi:Fic family protein